MKKVLLFLFSAFLFSSCSAFSIKNEISETDKLKAAKNVGVIFRIQKTSFVSEEEYRQTLRYWVEGHQQLKKLALPTDADTGLTVYKTDADRFYQLSPQRDFLTFKSLGVIKYYLQTNRPAVEEIMSKGNLDLLVIYEVDGFFQAELQYVDFNSIVVILDKSMNVHFLDRQNNTYHINEVNPEKVKKHLLDKVSERFIETMIDLDFLEEK